MEDLRKLFGTDGIRGVANLDLTPDFVTMVGKAGAKYLSSGSNKNQILIGRDTRPSGELIRDALVSGITSCGVNVLDAGIITTPAVALLVKLLDLDGGIVISASHNPVEDNGIKFFGKGGRKLTDTQEKNIEDFILNTEKNTRLSLPKNLEEDGSFSKSASNANNLKIQKIPGLKNKNSAGTFTKLENANEIYTNYLLSSFNLNLAGLKIVIDCANGAAGILAPKVLELFGAEVSSYNVELSGKNINRGCGSTHPGFLAKSLLEKGADIGFSFDGDGDRVIAVDNKGRILDGDTIIAFCAIYMMEKGTLRNNCVVTTVMANIGFDKVLEGRGIKIYKTNVGDRYVLEKMNETKCSIGGEQSGHIIFSDISPTGDGIISTLEFLNVLINNNYDLEKIYDMVPKYPQTLKNVKVSDKEKILSSEVLINKILEMEKKLEGNGKVLVRPSGTEPLIRVMVEAQTQELADKITLELAEIILMNDQNA